jgi:cytochrome c-type biogenesis protein CcmF
MIAEAGLALLWISACLAGLQLLLGIVSLRQGDSAAAMSIRPVAATQGLLVTGALLCLIWLFIRTDLSVLLVAENSHSAKPMLYKVAGAWGNHEGSMLLWVTILGLAGAAVALFERRLSREGLTATLAAQAAISLGFYAFLLLSSNPFARLFPVPQEGQGLNPLLQDPGLAFHPPTLYFGYVGMSVAFSFAVGALITREVNQNFARAMRPWVLGAWIFLTLGITAGSYWAYYELGWGGWWFWDPVENASLMPWLATTALLHSVTVLATRNGLRAWTVMLAVIAFSMSMVGTFLVRSGVLTSVHAFAVDPQRGSFILALLFLYIGGAMTLFALRVSTVREGSQFDLISREGALVLNNLLLCCILTVVLVGTLAPLAAQAFGTQISIGPPYFNPLSAVFALPMLALMAAGPLLRWRSDRPILVLRRLAVPLSIGVIMMTATWLLFPTIGWLPRLGLVFAIWVGAASLAPLWKRNLARTPLFTWGMVMAHLGIAVAMGGMASESAFTQETLAALTIGDTRVVGPYQVTLKSVEPVAGPNWTALESVLLVKRGTTSFEQRPQARMFSAPPTETSEAAIKTVLDGQLYLVLGQKQADGRWQLRMWWKPFVTLIWLGGAMVAFGGFLALVGRLRRELWPKRPRYAGEELT